MKRIVLTAACALALAIAASGSAAAASNPASQWHVGYYTPSPHGALSFSQAPSAPNALAALNFTNSPDTALLVTKQKAKNGSLLGDMTGKTVSATFTISGANSAFTYYGEGTDSNPCGTPANTRLYFETSNAGGFAYTNYWWSNPSSAVLANGTWTVTAPLTGGSWSDWNGQDGITESAGFAKAVKNVTAIGLSFGGGCFFENGVGTADGSGKLTLSSYSAN